MSNKKLFPVAQPPCSLLAKFLLTNKPFLVIQLLNSGLNGSMTTSNGAAQDITTTGFSQLEIAAG